MNDRLNIMALKITPIRFDDALEQVKVLGIRHIPSYVCFANVHMMVEAHKDPVFAKKVNNATMVLADGSPIAKACTFLQNQKQERIAGMDFMPRLLNALNEETVKSYRIFLYGSTQEVLDALTNCVHEKYKNVQIAGSISPAFRQLTPEEIDAHINAINISGAHIVFVGLGCPKQEKWMAANYQKINAVLLGVGGAFLTTAGLQKRAPRIMQKAGLEWVYRLKQEPKRLFKRYLVTNSLFLGLLIKSFAKKLIYGKP